jgi:hypothetical protein
VEFMLGLIYCAVGIDDSSCVAGIRSCSYVHVVGPRSSSRCFLFDFVLVLFSQILFLYARIRYGSVEFMRGLIFVW